MTADALRSIYQAYLDCLNAQDWPRLGDFVHNEVSHNDRPFGLAGYRAMLENDFQQIPDLWFKSELVVCEPPAIAARLKFDCTPKGSFLDLPIRREKPTTSAARIAARRRVVIQGDPSVAFPRCS
jgi:predicted ester cyclase